MNLDLEIGEKVFLHTKKGDFGCVVLESPSSDIILVKLESGYNIGIREEDILNVKRLKEGKEKRKEVKKIESKKDLPTIALVVTGGTISAKLDTKTGGVSWFTDADELMEFYPELLGVANIKKIEVPFMKASEDMDAKDWEMICKSVAGLLKDPEIKGVVVTHGTDFLHYTAAALSFGLGKLSKPVVLTYSQRSSDRASSDARLNLLCSARAAISDIAEVMLVGHANLDDEYCYALSGTKVRKMHTSRRDTFRPINANPVAKVYADKVEPIREYNPRKDKSKVELVGKFSNKVALIKFYPGQDPDILDYYVKKGYKGIVIEAAGLGHVATPASRKNWIAKLRKFVKRGVIVCAAPQTLYGRLDPLIYSNGRMFEETGTIFLRDMLPETAFVKLSFIIARTKNSDKIKKFMLSNIAGEFNDCLSEEEFLN